MNLGLDWGRIQRVADHRMALKTIRGVAIGSVIWGGVVLTIAMLPPLDLFTAALGVVLLATGSWNLTRPKPVGIVLDGLTICLVGVYNIGAAFVGDGGTGWAKLGVFQLIWGAQEIMRFGKFREALAFEPQDTELQALDESIRAINKGKPKESPDLIEFTMSGLQAKLWRGRLMDDGAILVKRGTHEAVVVRRHELEIQPGNKVMIGKEIKATFAIDGKTHKGTILPQSLERFQQWKHGSVIPAALAA
jgi:hypothetical protein